MSCPRARFVTAILLHTLTASSASLASGCTGADDVDADRAAELDDLADAIDDDEDLELAAEPAEAPQPELELHPCGNAVLDDGEDCDHGAANGPDRECTNACVYNDCDLDEQGVCITDSDPVADVPLHPCTWTDGCTAAITR